MYFKNVSLCTPLHSTTILLVLITEYRALFYHKESCVAGINFQSYSPDKNVKLFHCALLLCTVLLVSIGENRAHFSHKECVFQSSNSREAAFVQCIGIPLNFGSNAQ